jgi:hypothetical protein
MKIFIGCAIGLLAVLLCAFTALIYFFDTAQLQELAKVAPVATAVIALVAATVALTAMFLQRDTAQRRAAIDFFLKTETDDGLIQAYGEYQELLPKLPQIIATPNLNYYNADYRKMRKWLNLCELIAVGIRLKAFSNKVSLDYWGYVLPDTFRESRPLIDHIRQTPGLGGPNTFKDFHMLAKKWSKKDDRKGLPKIT